MPSKHSVAGSSPAGIASVPGEAFALRLADGLGWLAARRWRSAMALLLLSLALFLPGQQGLQPMDRDEPRFAQATKQMLETGDVIDIRFQHEARHKKPVGIYWLQAAVVTAAERLGLPDARTTIALYRIPSWLAATGAVLLTWWVGLAFLSARGALVAAALLGSTVLLGVEARLAKTDAAVLLTVVAAMGVLARAWLHHVRPDTQPAVSRRLALLFWVAIGIGILIKGPITPMVPAFAAAVLAFRERSVRWLLALRPLSGLVVVALVVLPWLVAITLRSGGSFFADSLGEDMLAKVGQGQEKHWGPPGYYLVAFWATAWPMAVFVGLAFRFLWRERRDDGVIFLLAWAFPTWLLFELVQTKLPHYVLPTYPALAIVAVMALERNAVPFAWWAARVAAVLALLVPVALLVGVPAVHVTLDRWLPFLALPLLLAGVVLAWFAMRRIQQARALPALAFAIASALPLAAATYPFAVGGLGAIDISRRLAAAGTLGDCPTVRHASAGYNEPSLVFLVGTDLQLVEGHRAAALFATPGCAVAFVDRRQEEAFLAALPAEGRPALRTRVMGLNINSGRRLDIGVYVRGP